MVMVNFTREDVSRRMAEAEGKIALAEVTGIEKTAKEAELDKRFAELMSSIIKNQETDLKAFFR